MHKKLFLWLVLLPAALRAQAPQSFRPVAPEAAGFSAARLARLDSFLADGVKRGLFPHVVTFVARGGGVVHHKAFGYRQLAGQYAPAHRRHFPRGLPVESHHLHGPDDPLRRRPVRPRRPGVALPARLQKPRVLESYDTLRGTYAVRPAQSEITIRQLLTHTAGIPYEHPLQTGPNSACPTSIRWNGKRWPP
jgi:CubicO group peptidase (beta-lactamase class C family)